MRCFYQDRLGTNIGKALKKSWRFLIGYVFAILHIVVLVVLLAGSVRRDVLVARTDTILSEVCYSRLLVLLGLLAAVVSSDQQYGCRTAAVAGDGPG